MLKHAEKHEIKLALVGQPNSGKSTLFNAASGFRVNTGNFPGTTVSFAETKVNIDGHVVTLIDLPGTYSITSHDLAEKVTRDYLLSGKVDVLINVIDASMLARSLELTLQLIEMNIPLVVAMNMMDEAGRKGIEVDFDKFKNLIGTEAYPVNAVQGIGVNELFRGAISKTTDNFKPKRPTYDRDVEDCLESIVGSFSENLRQVIRLDTRFVAIRLLEMDADFEHSVSLVDMKLMDNIRQQRKALAELHNWPESGVFASHRHALVLDLYEKFVQHRRVNKVSLRNRIDAFFVNPIGGSVVVALSVFSMFYVSFCLGDIISGIIEKPFFHIRSWISNIPIGILQSGTSGLVDGLEAGVGIVLPYFVPLLFLLAVYEDSGILPRIAFIVDGLLHRVGMHGKSIVPIILGYGCNVPAILATRNLENERDRKLAMLIIPFITCSARTVIILGLVGKYLGALAAALVYVGTIAVTFTLSFVLSRINIHLDAGLLMEVPPLRLPFLRIIFKKVWLQLYQFLVAAWPVIILSSILLAIGSSFGIDEWINHFFSPFTKTIMNLPQEVGITIFLGIFRKELVLVMLNSALKTGDVGTVLSTSQLITLTVFSVLYIPCIATLSILKKEGGWRLCLTSAALNFGIALFFAAIVARF